MDDIAKNVVRLLVSADLYQAVVSRYPDRVATVIEDALRDFLNRSGEDFRARSSSRDGLRWERVILPDGTRFRTKCLGKYHYADVKGDKAVFNGEEFTSVSRLARRMRGDTSVNACIHLEVMRPGDRAWVRANQEAPFCPYSS